MYHRPRSRKKRRTTSERTRSLSQSTISHIVTPDVRCDQPPGSDSNNYHTPTNALEHTRVDHPVIRDNLWTGSANPTYMGRAHYIRDDEEIDEARARSFPSTRLNGLSHLEMSTIAAFNGFQLPSSSIRHELMTSFNQYCFPWMPILHGNDVNSILCGTSSPLLAQALYVAASRVSPSPKLPSVPSITELYERAKILFWMGHENNPINSIKATLLMQWYNPEGPEHVSLDTSEFWLRTGVGLAYQVGLHKEPAQGPWHSMRRRLWWSLVVLSPPKVAICMRTNHSRLVTRSSQLLMVDLEQFT
jgi:hypothetical protein